MNEEDNEGRRDPRKDQIPFFNLSLKKTYRASAEKKPGEYRDPINPRDPLPTELEFNASKTLFASKLNAPAPDQFEGLTLPTYYNKYLLEDEVGPSEELLNFLGNFRSGSDQRAGALNLPLSLRRQDGTLMVLDEANRPLMTLPRENFVRPQIKQRRVAPSQAVEEEDKEEEEKDEEMLPQQQQQLQAQGLNEFDELWRRYKEANKARVPKLTEGELQAAVVRDIQRLRYQEIQLMLRGGKMERRRVLDQHNLGVKLDPVPTDREVRFISVQGNPTTLTKEGRLKEVPKRIKPPTEKELAEADFPEEFKRKGNQYELASIALTKDWHGKHIYFHNIPPLISHVSWELFSEWIRAYLEASLPEDNVVDADEAIALNNSLSYNFLNLYWNNSSFKFPAYLGTALEKWFTLMSVGGELEVYIETMYLVMDFKDGFEMFWKTCGGFYRMTADVSPGDVLMQHFHNIYLQFIEMENRYETKTLFEASVHFANWRIFPIGTNKDIEESAKAFTMFPVDMAVEYGKYPPILEAGLCIGEALFWLTFYRDGKGSRNIKTCRKEFIEWMRSMDQERYVQIKNGDLKFLENEVVRAGYVWQMIDVECWTYTIGAVRQTFPADCSEPGWASETFSNTSPIFVYNAYHIFEIDIEALARLTKSRAAPRWSTEPMKPINYVEEGEGSDDEEGDRRKKKPKVEKPREVLDCFLDIECYNTECGIQLPYCIVWKESGKPAMVFKKKDAGEDLASTFRLWLYQTYVSPWYEQSRQKHRQKWCEIRAWAHNGAKYDFVYILDVEVLAGSSFLGDPDNAKAFTWGPITFTDFYHFFKGSLVDLTKEFFGPDAEGKKDHVDFDLITETTWPEHIEKMSVYCEQDVALLEKLVAAFLDMICGKEYNGIMFHPRKLITASSLALSIFKKCFNTHWIYPCPKDQYWKFMKPYERFVDSEGIEHEGGNAYNGGLTVCAMEELPHQQACDDVPEEKKQGYHVDVVSCYPTQMKEELMPTKYLQSIVYNRSFDLEDIPPCPAGVVRLVHVTRWNVNPLCNIWHLAQTTKEGLFYTSTFEGKAGTWRWEKELTEWSKNGTARFEFDAYDEWEAKPVFADYVNHFFEMKERAKREGQPIICSFAKLMLNSLYGKMGQKRYRKMYFGPVGRMAEIFRRIGAAGIRHVKRVFDCVCVTFHEFEELNHSGAFISLASMVTALGRNFLMRGMHRVGFANVAYVDTDSIISSVPLPDSMCLPKGALGTWELEGIVKTFHGHAPKHYRIEYEPSSRKKGKEVIVRKLKGIPSSMVVEEIFHHDYNHGENPQIIPKVLQMRKFFGGEGGRMVVSKMDKKLRGVTSRRIFVSPCHSILFRTLDEAQRAAKASLSKLQPTANRVKPFPLLTSMSVKKFNSLPGVRAEESTFVEEIRRLALFLAEMKILVPQSESVEETLKKLLGRAFIPENLRGLVTKEMLSEWLEFPKKA